MKEGLGYSAILAGILGLTAVYVRNPSALSPELVVGAIVALIGLAGVLLQIDSGHKQEAARSLQEARMRTFDARSATFQSIMKPFRELMLQKAGGPQPQLTAQWMSEIKWNLVLYSSAETLQAWENWLAAGAKGQGPATSPSVKKLRDAAALVFLARFIQAIREDYGATNTGLDERIILKSFVLAAEIDNNAELATAMKFRHINEIP